jgi:hypothetical protein
VLPQRIAQAAIVTQAVAPVIRDPDIKTEDGPSRADILLEAIVITARKQQTVATRAAMRSLIAKVQLRVRFGF